MLVGSPILTQEQVTQNTSNRLLDEQIRTLKLQQKVAIASLVGTITFCVAWVASAFLKRTSL